MADLPPAYVPEVPEEEEEEEEIVEEAGGSVVSPASPRLPAAVPAVVTVLCPTCDYPNLSSASGCANPFGCEIAQCWCRICDGLIGVCEHGPDQRPIKLEEDRRLLAEAEAEEERTAAPMPSVAETTLVPMEESAASSAACSSFSTAAGISTPAVPSESAVSVAALRTHLRHLLRPFGPLHFTLATEPEPSIVPVPTKLLYPESVGGDGKPGRKRPAEGRPDEVGGLPPEQFYAAVRDLKALPLVRVGRHGAAYDMQRAASFLSLEAARADSQVDDLLSDSATLGHIAAVERYLAPCSRPGTPEHKKLWLQHEYFDPYRLFTHAPPAKSAPVAHPGTRETGETRYAAFMEASAATATVALPVSSSLSFLSSHIALQMAELDTLHSLFTTPAQRSREGVASALAHPPGPKEMFKTVVDLSGGEGAASEYILWKRRVVNLRAKIWAYDLNATQEKKNWRDGWKNAIAIEQSKNLNVFHPPWDASNASLAEWPKILSQLISESSIDSFMRAIDHETKGVGVQLAVAAGYQPMPKATGRHATSMSYRLQPETMYPTLLFQVDCALRTLARGGTLLLQLHETHTPFTLSLFFLLFQVFDHCILQQLGGTVGYASGQCFLLCTDYLHDRLTTRPSGFPVIAALRQLKSEVFARTPDAIDWSRRAFVQPQHWRANPEFVRWVKKYNEVAHAYQLSCALALLQATPIQPTSLLEDLADPGETASAADSTIFPLPPAQHRTRISMMAYSGLPIPEPFGGTAGARR